MRVWLVHMGETVQSDGPDVRLYRLGVLAEHLVARGHEVERWVPTFMHNQKRHRFEADTDIAVSERHRIRHIYAAGFRHDRGPARMRFHRQVARRWVVLGRQSEPPDLIVTSLPTPELARAGIALGRIHGCPVVIDIRDLWPDVYATMVSAPAKPLVRLMLSPLRAQVGRTLREAQSIVAVSESYLSWGLGLAKLEPRLHDRVVPLSYQPTPSDESLVEGSTAAWRERLKGTRLTCLFLGTFSKSFTLSDVVLAARLLEARRPGEVSWVLGGDGPTRAAVASKSEGLANVHVPGWVSGAEAMALLRLSSLGLAPYSNDALQSLPNKPFEYACFGLPVLSSLQGELSLVVDEHGLGANYRSRDPEALACIVERYLDDPALLERQGKATRNYWETQMSPTAVYDGFVELLEEVAENGDQPESSGGAASSAGAAIGVRDSSSTFGARPRGYFGKRAFDVMAALVGVIVLSPVFAAVAVIVRVSSRGPVIYRGARVGWAGADFEILKFRTMRHDVTSQLTTSRDDPRVTRVGRVLRRFKLDELPQLFNVLRGDMSLVGPRPEFRFWVNQYAEHEQLILAVRPGITDLASLEFFDLASVVGSDGDADAVYLAKAFGRKNALRLEYVESMSWRTDLSILGRTLRRTVTA